MSSSSSVSISSSSSTPVVVNRSLTLTPQFQKNVLVGSRYGYRLRIDVLATDMPSEIFLYHRKPSTILLGVYQGDGTQPDQLTSYLDECVGVCSVVDLEEFPVNAPNTEDCPQGFRRNYFDAVFDSAVLVHGDADQGILGVWDLFKGEAAALVDSLNEIDILEAGDVFTYG